MTSPRPARTLEVRHLQIARAAFAALAAIMVTFSPDHSAVIGMSIFSGFAITTALAFFAAVWLVYPSGRRWPAMLLGTTALIAGMAGGLAPLRTIPGFFVTVIAWALISGVIELTAGWRELRHAPGRARREIAPGVVDAGPYAAPGPASEARDGVVIGVITVILGLALLVVPTQYALRYTVAEAHQSFTLTGIIIGVGLFGGYAVIVAVYLAIAGFSPRRPLPIETEAATASADQKDPA
ncbi:acyl-CoA synthetase [Microbacterium deminutum]|uniref:Acyl-CoA synthetase n=1 Tax=Microbacterium deminutum TaxID=344164 RepID=A0ABP5C0Z5_9MICO